MIEEIFKLRLDQERVPTCKACGGIIILSQDKREAVCLNCGLSVISNLGDVRV